MGASSNFLGRAKPKTDKAPEPAKSSEEKKKTAHAELVQATVDHTVSQWSNSEKDPEGPQQEDYREKSIRLGSILLDKQNHRTKHINVAKPTVNTLPEDHPEYQKNQDLIENLKEFAEHVKYEPIRQLPGVYASRNKYYMAYGHRRFLALLIAFGPDYLHKFKIYTNKPVDLAKARFQENQQREDVALADKLLDFQAAKIEAIKLLEGSNQPIYSKNIASRLALSAPVFSIYDRSLSKPFLMEMLEKGEITEYQSLRKAINSKDRDEARVILGLKKAAEAPKKAPRGRPKKYVQFPKLTSRKLIRRIIEGELASFEWKDEDFESFDTLTEKINECIESMSKVDAGE